MKYYDQTKFGKEEGGCFNACLGSIVDIEPDDIPFFMDATGAEDWYGELTAWLKTIGCYPMQFELKEPNLDNMSHYGVYILSGKSPRPEIPYPECTHSVLANGDKIIHDPHPSRDGIETYDDFIVIVKGVLP